MTITHLIYTFIIFNLPSIVFFITTYSKQSKKKKITLKCKQYI